MAGNLLPPVREAMALYLKFKGKKAIPMTREQFIAKSVELGATQEKALQNIDMAKTLGAHSISLGDDMVQIVDL